MLWGRRAACSPTSTAWLAALTDMRHPLGGAVGPLELGGVAGGELRGGAGELQLQQVDEMAQADQLAPHLVRRPAVAGSPAQALGGQGQGGHRVAHTC